jgi:V8-like Glu-specific endopeptidase
MSFLDDLPYPWNKEEARELHKALTALYPSGQAAVLLARMAGIDGGSINGQQAPADVLRDILDEAARQGLGREIVATARDRLPPTAPRRSYFEALLANQLTSIDREPQGPGGEPGFIKNDDSISDPEALLYRDDLTLQIGRVPALIATLGRIVKLAPAVCRLTVDVSGREQTGSGFRIGNDRLLTNWHVVHLTDGARATSVTAEFGYEDDGTGGLLAGVIVPCKVETIVTNQADDWAVIEASVPLEDSWPILNLADAADPVIGDPAYIVQHPLGERKRLGFVRNQISFFDDRVVQYLTDTQEGSSGSPVFDKMGRLIALHHVGGRPQDVTGRAPVKKNEGIRIARIVAGLQGQGVAVP